MSAVIVVHGGAWAIPDELAQACVDGVKVASRDGFSVLKRGGSAVDAVEAAVRTLEDNTVFNAGHGAVQNADGEVEMDAIIMDGRTLSSGAVSAVKNIANPVSLARAVMEKTDHMILTDRGANQFAESIGVVTVPTDSLVTEYERNEWAKRQGDVARLREVFDTQWAHDTVGAVAVDCDGNVACATSTGGTRNKMAGRVGDSPIIGCGGYADNFIGAASCTGHGESLLKVTLARLILFHVEQGKSVAESSQLALQYMADRVHGAGGCIVVSPSGQWATTFTSKRMAWAAVDHDGLWNLKMSAVIVVHGGVRVLPDERDKACVDGAKVAARDGFSVLKRGGSAVDAVEAAVRTMEDNTVFNAGHGAVQNADGEVEMDAIIMDGRTLSSGAVSAVKNIANPVSLARAVMEKTDHMILTDRGANQFAESIGVVTVPTDSLVTEYERKEWAKHQGDVARLREVFDTQWAHDTVGAVAVDCDGNVACATSTGGARNKMAGRVGDSPIIGCGGYADNFIGAASCTGHGESLLKVTLARLILFHVEQGKSVAESSQLALQYMADRVHGAGGCIVVSPSGQWATTFTSKRMAWAAVDHDGLWYGLDPNEKFKDQF